MLDAKLSCRDEAREYFSKKGLTFKDMTEPDIIVLKYILEYVIRISPQYYWRGIDNCEIVTNMDGGLSFAQITGFSEYFSKREVITFHGDDAYISFSGASDKNNIIPVVQAFKLWCDVISSCKNSTSASDDVFIDELINC